MLNELEFRVFQYEKEGIKKWIETPQELKKFKEWIKVFKLTEKELQKEDK